MHTKKQVARSREKRRGRRAPNDHLIDTDLTDQIYSPRDPVHSTGDREGESHELRKLVMLIFLGGGGGVKKKMTCRGDI